jgi:hypothetical protein
VASPQAGAYVLYVYSLKEAALHLAVDSRTAPDAQLDQLSLQREEIAIASFDQPAPLDKAMTATFHQAPMVVSLLYEGSVDRLDAKVASGKGDVLTITGESGTAFSPGVVTDQTGSRASSFGNLDGLAYTATAHARSFQGTMVLVGLSLELPRSVPVEVEAPGTPSAPPTPPANPHLDAAAPALRLSQGRAFAFEAQPGELKVADPQAKDGNGRDGAYYGATVLVFTPDDKLLGIVSLNRTNGGVASIALPRAGEYVAFVERAGNLAVYAQVPGGDGVARELKLGHESFDFNADALSPTGAQQTRFELLHAPVRMALDGSQALAVLGGADVRNEMGVVASWQGPAQVPGMDLLGSSGYSVSPHFAAGEHVFEAWQFTQGAFTLKTTYYLRDTPVAPPAPATPAEPASPPEPAEGNETGNGTAENATWDPMDPTDVPTPFGPGERNAPALPRLALPRVI